MPRHIISVIGGLAADLIFVVPRMPEAGESLITPEYYESLGGKGANSAIATHRTCHKRPAKDKEGPDGSDQTPGTAIEGGTSNTVTPVGGEDEDEVEVRMIGAIGDDSYAGMFHAQLRQNGIDTSGLRTIAGERSSLAFIIVDKYTGDNRCLGNVGATGAWKEEDFLKVEDLANGEKPELVISQLVIRKGVVQQMIETAGRAGIDFLLNAAPADPIERRCYRYITHLLVNETEAAIMSGRDLEEVTKQAWPEIAQEFLDLGVKNVVLTLGAQGAYYATASESGHVPAYKVDVVDATGAGDTFNGAYASDYVRQKARGTWDIKSAVVRANKAAALTITKYGAQEGIPWSDEIDQFEGVYLGAETVAVERGEEPQQNDAEEEREEAEATPTKEAPTQMDWPGVNVVEPEAASMLLAHEPASASLIISSVPPSSSVMWGPE